MTEAQPNNNLARLLVPVGLAALVFAVLMIYAGYRHALGDVCAARARFAPAAYASTAAALIAAVLSIWGAVRRKGWPSIIAAAFITLASVGVILYAFLTAYFSLSGFAEFSTDLRVSDDGNLQFNLTEEGFRVSEFYIEGPAGRWGIRAIDPVRPPLISQIGSITVGRVPDGYTETESLKASFDPLPDGQYRARAIVACAYRPATASFTIRQGRLNK